MISSAVVSNSDLVAMTTLVTPHPHLNQIHNLRQQHNPSSDAISTALSGGAGSRERASAESSQSKQVYFSGRGCSSA